MSHINIDIIDFILLTIYPVIPLLVIELVYKITKMYSRPKLLFQASALINFCCILFNHNRTSLDYFYCTIFISNCIVVSVQKFQ